MFIALDLCTSSRKSTAAWKDFPQYNCSDLAHELFPSKTINIFIDEDEKRSVNVEANMLAILKVPNFGILTNRAVTVYWSSVLLPPQQASIWRILWLNFLDQKTSEAYCWRK